MKEGVQCAGVRDGMWSMSEPRRKTDGCNARTVPRPWWLYARLPVYAYFELNSLYFSAGFILLLDPWPFLKCRHRRRLSSYSQKCTVTASDAIFASRSCVLDIAAVICVSIRNQAYTFG